MIKLTALHYTIKTSALERFHNINENSSRLMFDWEKANERATNTGEPYTNKPFIEPFDFEIEDYDVREEAFRIRVKDIYSLKENAERNTELTVAGDISYTIKETIEEIEKLIRKNRLSK